MGIWPEIPGDAKQTNCWRLAFILEILGIIANIIQTIFSGLDAGTIIGQIIGQIIGLVIAIIAFYHVAYVRTNVSESLIEITMGPLQWPVFRWFCSSQVTREEVVLVRRKQRECFWDVCPRFYCAPVTWCCCHKSYAAYYWPCCCNDINCCGLCEGDSDSSDMIVIDLTVEATEFQSMCFKRCAPCPCPCPAVLWCCVYNRIAVSIRDDTIWNELQSCNYPLTLNQGAASASASVDANEGTAIAATNDGNTYTN